MFFFLGKFRNDVYQLREAFQTKKWGNLGKVQNWGGGGGGGALQKSKQSQVPEGTKDSKNDDSFSSYEETKT